MNFKSWLQNEMMWRPAGQAMSKDDYLRRQADPDFIANNRFQSYDKRVETGKSVEQKIFDSLVACGMKLKPASNNEDMFSKIDAWWDTGKGVSGLQIKYRDTGDDILFEVMKDVKRNILGRDMIGKADYYAVLRTTGDIVVVAVAEAKKIIEQGLKTVKQNGMKDAKIPAGNSFAFFKIRPDARTGQNKLMAFLPVSALTNIRPPCKVQ